MKADEIEDYAFGEEAPPDGFKPDAKAFEDPPIGVHSFVIDTFEIEPNHTFKGKDFDQVVLNQLRPRLLISTGEHAGKGIMDFLPLPTPGRPMPKLLANRWANFMRAFGFELPQDALAPPGFKLHSLIGATGSAEIIDDEYDGKVRRKVKFFGYIKPGNGTRNTTATPTSSTTSPASGETTIPDLGDL